VASSIVPTAWPDAVDEILAGDHAVALAYVTPARGVVITPVSNFGLHNRATGVVTVNSSVGAWKKLERIRRNPQVALALHTRAHATHNRPEYVLVQGHATLTQPIPDYPSTVLENWERLEPWRDLGPLWKRWLRVYALRAEIRIAVERVTVWPNLTCSGVPIIYGEPPADAPAAQAPPAKGTGPRINHARAARRAARLPDVLLGWTDADGYPKVVSVRVVGSDARGIELAVAGRTVAPPGGRRAGLTAHWFSRGVTGQRQAIHTGWMTPAGRESIIYSPHTSAVYRMPASRLVYRIAAGFVTRRRSRKARP
jgi:hypothetical protein